MTWKQIVADFLGIKPVIRYKEKTITIEKKPLDQIREFPKQLHKVKLTPSDIHIAFKNIKIEDRMEINDRIYYGVNLLQFQKFADWMGIDKMPYGKVSECNSEEDFKEFFGDCNVYGYGLKGVVGLWDSTLPVACCLGYFDGSTTYHFTILLITDEKEPIIFSPQTNCWREVQSNDKIRFVRF